jgi:hypothetical protein
MESDVHVFKERASEEVLEQIIFHLDSSVASHRRTVLVLISAFQCNIHG